MAKMKNVTGALTLKGVGGQMSVDQNFVTIHRKGALAKTNHGLKGEKRIPLKSIVAVQIKKPGMTNGYIQFTIGGGNESRGGVLAATKDENTVVFTSHNSADAYAIRDYIEFYIINGHAPDAKAPAVPPPPTATTPPPPPTPAQWAPDPHGRHGLRYFDGSRWTEHVSTAGVQSVDPVP